MALADTIHYVSLPFTRSSECRRLLYLREIPNVSQALAHYVSHWARTRPSKTAYLGGSTPLSWADYESASEDLAYRLMDELSLSRGDRVAVLLPDGPEVHTAFLACDSSSHALSGGLTGRRK